MEIGVRLAAAARQLLSKLDGLLHVPRRLTAAPVSLAGTFDCYISRTGVQAEVQSSCPPSTHSWTKAGGEYRARTGDLLVANQALSQLS